MNDNSTEPTAAAEEIEGQHCKNAKIKFKIHLNNGDEHKEMKLEDLLSSSERRFSNPPETNWPQASNKVCQCKCQCQE